MAEMPEPEALLEHRAFLRAIAKGLVRDEHAAEDVAQETLLAAMERPPQGRNVCGWLGAVARNLLLMARRGGAPAPGLRETPHRRRGGADRGQAAGLTRCPERRIPWTGNRLSAALIAMAFLLLCEDCMARIAECLNRLRTMRRAFGTRAVALFLFDRLLARTVRLEVNTVVWLPEEVVRIGPEAAPDFEFRFLSAEEVEAFSSSPDHHLTPDFAERIRRGRDFCYAAIAQDGRLAAYGWYALEEIEPEHCAGAAMQLPQDVAYMYKGYTHPDFRGARLHGAGMGGALRALGGYGVQALVSTVHWTNFASLRSCGRLGYTTLGRIVSWRLLGRRRLRAPAEVHGVRIGAHCIPAAPREPVLAH